MTTFLNPHPPWRSVLVAFVVGVATASVASKVALQESAVAQMPFGTTTGVRLPASTPARAAPLGRGDPSLPDAAAVVGRSGIDTGEPSPTF
jgi:hypothetical protein